MLLHLLPGKAHFPTAEQLHGDREKTFHGAPSAAPRLGEAHYPALLCAVPELGAEQRIQGA